MNSNNIFQLHWINKVDTVHWIDVRLCSLLSCLWIVWKKRDAVARQFVRIMEAHALEKLWKFIMHDERTKYVRTFRRKYIEPSCWRYTKTQYILSCIRWFNRSKFIKAGCINFTRTHSLSTSILSAVASQHSSTNIIHANASCLCCDEVAKSRSPETIRLWVNNLHKVHCTMRRTPLHSAHEKDFAIFFVAANSERWAADGDALDGI